MTTSKYPRGSEWRKWDLHIHTPDSIFQNYGANKWNEFIVALENLPEDVKVIGINDYYFIDGYQKVINEKLKNNRLQNIEKIFPILEFRIDTFASASETNFQKINFHILFDLDENNIQAEIKKVKEEFIEQIHLTKLPEHKTKILSKDNLIKNSSGNNLQNGFDELIPCTDEVFKLLESDTWINKTFLFLGFKEWNNLDKGKQLKIFKKDLCNRVETFLSASKIDSFEKKNEILKEYGDKIILHSMDIHSFNTFDNYECYTWIKADPTFEGLKQILYEKERVYIGDKPEKLNYIKLNKELFIESIKIESSSDDDEWFDKITNEIKLNPGLVSIIGNKGHGKSAFSDILGSLSNYDTSEYSFLHPQRFLKFPRKDKYEARILFRDNYSNKKLLSDTKHDNRKPVKAIYLSQHFVTKICEDIGSSLLHEQIDDVIFSYVPEEEQLGCNNLTDLISYKTKIIEDKIYKQKKKLYDINIEIVNLEEKKSKQSIEKIREHLEEKKRQLVEHLANKGKKPQKLKGNTKSTAIDKLNQQIKTKKNELDRLQKQLNEISKEKEQLNTIKNEIEQIETGFKDIISIYKNDKVIKKYKINLTQDFTYNFNYTKLENQIKVLNSSTIKLGQKKKELNNSNKSLTEELIKIEKELNKNEQEYKTSLEAYKNWERKVKELTGNPQTPDTIKYYEDQLNFINKRIDQSLKVKRAERKDIISMLINLIFEKKKIYPEIFKEAQEYAQQRAIEFNIRDEFIDFDSKVKLKRIFIDEFYNLINKRYVGTFYNDSNKEILAEITGSLLVQTEEQLILFAEKLEDLIKKDYRNTEDDRTESDYDILIYQLKNCSLKDYYNFIYTFDYLETKTDITFGGKRLDELSPGERGTLLLIFYLLIDPDKKPIIIDQPEENLDNETVFQKIVPFIKKVKEERQVIIVTHNPNLAIVCDSEQIIHAYMDKKNNNLVSYNSGSIEFYKIREKAIDILEGTEPAFVNRKKKYAIK